MKSSYNKEALHYGNIFETLVFTMQPKKIVEFGILEGYSLSHFANAQPKDCIIEAYDIFEKFNGSSAKRSIIDTFPTVKIQEANFYDTCSNFEDNSIDILHIDIANDATTYQFAIENYMQKLTPSGIMVLEGGSEQRDSVEWMIKYKKSPIYPYLQSIQDKYSIYTISTFPSLTLIKKKQSHH